MKKILFFALLLPFFGNAQNYIDLLKIGYSQNFGNEFDGDLGETDIYSLDVDLTVPLVINDDNAIVTGAIFSRNNLQVSPGFQGDEAPYFYNYSGRTTLFNSILKLGLVTKFDDKWTGTFLALPKLASDYQDLSSEDFYMGGAAVVSFKKEENLKYSFGLYAMGQAFGLFTTPILGVYYLSPDQKFEMDITIPVSANINYRIGDTRKVGFDYYAIGRSFDIHEENAIDAYVDYVALEFTGYIEQGFVNNSVLLRLKAGYATNSAEVYANDDKIDFRVSAFDFGGSRRQISPDLSGSLFAKLEAVYRFDLSDRD